jgi:phage shock protein A
MGIFNRLSRIFSAKANTAVDTMENPAEISQQIIRELDEKFNTAISAEAEIKAISLKNSADLAKAKQEVVEWEKRLNGILDKIDKGDSSTTTADLAKTAATKYNDAVANVAKKEQLVAKSAEQVKTMEANVHNIQEAIEAAKDKSKNIEARQKVAEASETINKAMSSTNTDGLMGTLDRMEEKVAATEFRAEAYAGSAANSSAASQIDELIGSTSADDTLAAFRAKRTSTTK